MGQVASISGIDTIDFTKFTRLEIDGSGSGLLVNERPIGLEQLVGIRWITGFQWNRNISGVTPFAEEAGRRRSVHRQVIARQIEIPFKFTFFIWITTILKFVDYFLLWIVGGIGFSGSIFRFERIISNRCRKSRKDHSLAIIGEVGSSFGLNGKLPLTVHRYVIIHIEISSRKHCVTKCTCCRSTTGILHSARKTTRYTDVSWMIFYAAIRMTNFPFMIVYRSIIMIPSVIEVRHLWPIQCLVEIDIAIRVVTNFHFGYGWNTHAFPTCSCDIRCFKVIW